MQKTKKDTVLTLYLDSELDALSRAAAQRQGGCAVSQYVRSILAQRLLPRPGFETMATHEQLAEIAKGMPLSDQENLLSYSTYLAKARENKAAA